ncbi:MAG: FemAB family XrtA/PEP-CTERM system-associated protein [Planctomycetota bacterium]
MSDVVERTSPAETVTLRVERLGVEHDTLRDAFLRSHPKSTFFHQSRWERAIERVFHHVPETLGAYRGDRLVGVLPLMECRTLRGRRNLISMPYAVYGGAVANDPGVERALVESAKLRAEELAAGQLELRWMAEPRDYGMTPTSLYATFLRDLPDSPEKVLAQMPKKSRAEARKARERHGLELVEGRWYSDDLARLFLENKHNLGSPALPARHFHALNDVFGDDVTVHLVRQGREPVAAVMSFAWAGTLIAYYAGTRQGADRAVSASNFMYLSLQEWAVERGFRVFDFCRSRADSGAYRFKVHQGFEPRPLHYRFHLVRNRHTPSFTPSNPKTRILRETWAKLPTWVVRPVSDRLSRYLP